jgi:hypothetical protein
MAEPNKAQEPTPSSVRSCVGLPLPCFFPGAQLMPVLQMTLSQSVEKMRGYYLMYQREAFCAHSHQRSHVEPACSMLQGKCGMRDTGRALSGDSTRYSGRCAATASAC